MKFSAFAPPDACSSVADFQSGRAIWRGYEIIRDAGGWPCLVFAGMGLYRFCKYKLGFTPTNMTALKRLRIRFEVAADTIHPEWRQLLSVIGEPTTRVYKGHPCDWVVSRNGPPVPLADTYSQWTSDFSFEHLQECVIDEQAWGPMDPRAENNHNTHQTLPRRLLCERCGSPQSNDPGINECNCFPGMFGSGPRKPYPVQVFRTENGRNNGLLACCVSLPFFIRTNVLFWEVDRLPSPFGFSRRDQQTSSSLLKNISSLTVSHSLLSEAPPSANLSASSPEASEISMSCRVPDQRAYIRSGRGDRAITPASSIIHASLIPSTSGSCGLVSSVSYSCPKAFLRVKRSRSIIRMSTGIT